MSKVLNTQLHNIIQKLDEVNRKPITDKNTREWEVVKADLARFVLQHKNKIAIVAETSVKEKQS